MPTNKPEVVLPTVPQAFFDEFGVNADDRVMDYGQACYDAGVLSAAPQQSGQEVVEAQALSKHVVEAAEAAWNEAVEGLGFTLPSWHSLAPMRAALSSAMRVRSVDAEGGKPQQPAEAVVWVSESDLADSIARMKEDRPQVGWIRAFNSPDAANLGQPATPLFTTPPPAIDIGKLRELEAGWRRYDCVLNPDAKSFRKCADELAALIGDGGER